MAVMLKWTKANWPDKTYHSKTGSLSYAVDHDGTSWRVRGWIDGTFSLYRTGATMKEMRKVALDHANANS